MVTRLDAQDFGLSGDFLDGDDEGDDAVGLLPNPYLSFYGSLADPKDDEALGGKEQLLVDLLWFCALDESVLSASPLGPRNSTASSNGKKTKRAVASVQDSELAGVRIERALRCLLKAFGYRSVDGKVSNLMRKGKLPLPLTLLEVRLVSHVIRNMLDSHSRSDAKKYQMTPADHLVLATACLRASSRTRTGSSGGIHMGMARHIKRISVSIASNVAPQSDLEKKVVALRAHILANYDGKLILCQARAGREESLSTKQDVDLLGREVTFLVSRIDGDDNEVSTEPLKIGDDPDGEAREFLIKGGMKLTRLRLKVSHHHSILHMGRSYAKSDVITLEDLIRAHEATASKLCSRNEMQSGDDVEKLKSIIGNEFQSPWEQALESAHDVFQERARGLRRLSAESGPPKPAGTVRVFCRFDPPVFLFSSGVDAHSKVCEWRPVDSDNCDNKLVDMFNSSSWKETDGVTAYSLYALLLKSLLAHENPHMAIPEQDLINRGELGCDFVRKRHHRNNQSGIILKSKSGQVRRDFMLSQHNGFKELSKPSARVLAAFAKWNNVSELYQRLAFVCVAAQSFQACVDARCSVSTANDAVMAEPYFYDMINEICVAADDAIACVSLERQSSTLTKRRSFSESAPGRSLHSAVDSQVLGDALSSIAEALWTAIEFRSTCFAPAHHKASGTLLTLRDSFASLMRACRTIYLLAALQRDDGSFDNRDACRSAFVKRLSQVVFSGLGVQYELLKKRAIHEVGYAAADAYEKDAKKEGRTFKTVAHVVSVSLDGVHFTSSFNVLEFLGIDIDAKAQGSAGARVKSVDPKGAVRAAGEVSVGDTIIAINSVPVVSTNRARVISMLRQGVEDACIRPTSPRRRTSFTSRLAAKWKHLTEGSKYLDITFQQFTDQELDCASNELADGSLTVSVINAVDLIAADSNGLSDPYCVVKVGDVVQKTKIVRKTLDPVWDESFDFVVVNVLRDKITLSVKDWDMFSSDDDLGEVSERIATLMPGVVKLRSNARGVVNYEKTVDLPQKGSVTLKLSYKASFTAKEAENSVRRKGSSSAAVVSTSLSARQAVRAVELVRTAIKEELECFGPTITRELYVGRSQIRKGVLVSEMWNLILSDIVVMLNRDPPRLDLVNMSIIPLYHALKDTVVSIFPPSGGGRLETIGPLFSAYVPGWIEVTHAKMRDEYIPRILKDLHNGKEVIRGSHRAQDLAFMCRQNLSAYLQLPSAREGAHISRFARKLICDPTELFAETIEKALKELCESRLASGSSAIQNAVRSAASIESIDPVPVVASQDACILINEAEAALKRVYDHLSELHRIHAAAAAAGDPEACEEGDSESIKQYRLNLHVMRARGIPKMDWFSETDSFVVMKLANNMREMVNGIYEKRQTDVFRNVAKPDYNVHTTMECLAPSAILRIEVVDENSSKVERDAFIGFTDIAVGQRHASATELSSSDAEGQDSMSKSWHELLPYSAMTTRGTCGYKVLSKIEKLKSRGKIEVYYDFTSIPMEQVTEKRVYDSVNACRDHIAVNVAALAKPLIRSIVVDGEADYMEGRNWDMLNRMLNEQLRILSKGLSRPLFIKTILGIFREVCKCMVDLLLPGFASQAELYACERVLRALSFDAENEPEVRRSRSSSATKREGKAAAKLQAFVRKSSSASSSSASSSSRRQSSAFGGMGALFGKSRATRHFVPAYKKLQLNQAQRNSLKILSDVLTEFFGADGKGLKAQAAFDLQGPFALTTILAAFNYPIDMLRSLVDQGNEIGAQANSKAVNIQWASIMNVVLEYRVFVRATGSVMKTVADGCVDTILEQ